MTEKLKKLAPPGISLMNELCVYAFGMGISLLISFAYFIRLFDATSDYIIWSAVHGRMVNPDFTMPHFTQLIEGVFTGFFFVALCSLFLCVYHYTYYSSGGSHTLYLMNRLPDRWYLMKTCLTVPVLMALTSLAAAGVLTLLYYAVYLIATPKGYLPAGILAGIMEILI